MSEAMRRQSAFSATVGRLSLDLLARDVNCLGLGGLHRMAAFKISFKYFALVIQHCSALALTFSLPSSVFARR